MKLDFNLHKKQREIFDSKARFKVIAAGRRGGKSYLSAVMLIIKALETTNRFGMDMTGSNIFYVAPTYGQAREIMWDVLKEMARPLTQHVAEKDMILTLINGRTIKLKGSDRPDTLRGVKLGFVVIDEYADMKPDTWDIILGPALADSRGDAMFIGTPKGKNHFHALWTEADSDLDDEWEAFHFNSLDNPLVAPAEVAKMRIRMSADAFRQEFEASFAASGGGHFQSADFQYYDKVPEGGNYYIAVDPAGFGTGSGLSKSAAAALDECAIAIVYVCESGWYVEDILHGRWSVDRVALEITKAAGKYKPLQVGIEKGSLMNAMQPYLADTSRRLSVYPNIVSLSHGGKKKTERILWALQGRFQSKRIFFKKKAEWIPELEGQLLDIPNSKAHDDMADSLAYIDQMASVVYDIAGLDDMFDNYEVLDEWTGH